MRFIEELCDKKIKKAKEEGQFDCLDGKGKPLQLDDLSQVPEELRAGYLMLKNAGYLPEEMELKKEIVHLDDLIDRCSSPEEKQKMLKQKNEKSLRFNTLMEKRGNANSPTVKKYRQKLRRWCYS